MDTNHRDDVTRFLIVRPSRRGIARTLGGGLAALVEGRLAQHDVAAKKKHRKKRNKKKQPGQVSSPPPTPPPPPSPLTPPPPGPVTSVDATCTGPGAGYVGSERLAQTFTALASGPLVSAQLLIFKEAGSFGDYVLRLAPVGGDGAPTPGLLAETAVANATVPAGESTVIFTFRTPASVIAGTPYSLVLTRSGGDLPLWAATLSTACAGQGYFSRDQTGPFHLGTYDFIFTTFVSS